MQRAYSDRQVQAVLVASGAMKDRKLMDPEEARAVFEKALGMVPAARKAMSEEEREWRQVMGLS